MRAVQCQALKLFNHPKQQKNSPSRPCNDVAFRALGLDKKCKVLQVNYVIQKNCRQASTKCKKWFGSSTYKDYKGWSKLLFKRQDNTRCEVQNMTKYGKTDNVFCDVQVNYLNILGVDAVIRLSNIVFTISRKATETLCFIYVVRQWFVKTELSWNLELCLGFS